MNRTHFPLLRFVCAVAGLSLFLGIIVLCASGAEQGGFGPGGHPPLQGDQPSQPVLAAQFRPLGSLRGFDHMTVEKLSRNGAVAVGDCEGPPNDNGLSTGRSVRWTPAGGVEALANPDGAHPFSSSYAWGVSPDGNIIVGQGDDPAGDVASFLWRKSTGFSSVDIFAPFYGGPQSVDDNGAVVGSTYFSPPDQSPLVWELAVRWTSSAGPQLLGVLRGNEHEDVARAVSSDGAVIVGSAESAGDKRHAFRWTAESGLVSLGFLPGGSASEATDVSADGQVVVGWVKNASGSLEAFRWSGRTGMVGLGTPYGYESRANSISGDAAFIAGIADLGDYTQAVIWDAAHGWRWLKPLLASALGLSSALSGWSLTEAVGVASNPSYVFIAGNGVNPAGDAQGWWVRLPRTFVEQ